MAVIHIHAVCFARGVGLESNIALVVASLDLKLVQLLRDAIRTTDIAGARANGRHLIEPETEFLPRRHKRIPRLCLLERTGGDEPP